MPLPDRLAREVAAAIAADPAAIPDLFAAIQAGLAGFVAAQEARRQVLAGAAVRFLMGAFVLDRLPDPQLPFLVDPAYHQFPRGLAGHAATERDFWDQFLAVAAAEPLDRDWLRATRGARCLAWWDAVVVPALVARPG